MTPIELSDYLHRLILKDLRLSAMIWGPPGIGKSSIVAQAAEAHGLNMIDLRLSQLAPTDLRGLPVAADGLARWYPPEFLPQSGRGILFLDEINMAPPAVQGIAQQLILDRRVGSYRLPVGWFVWAAGNRKEDRASVFDMPAPLANRFLHLEVSPHFESFKAWAIQAGLYERILAFLAFRPALLHQIHPHLPAWPSPRSWEMASALMNAELSIEPAVGAAAAVEFHAYAELYDSLPDLAPILDGDGGSVPWPREPSVRYAVITALTLRAQDIEQHHCAFQWVAAHASAEWVQLFASDLFRLLRERGQLGQLAGLIGRDPALQRFLADYQALLAGG